MRCPSIPRLLLSVALGAAVSPVHAQASFPVAFDGSAEVLTEHERMELAVHLREAGRRWADLLLLDVPSSIEIVVVVSDAVPRATGASLIATFTGSDGLRDVYEQGVVHELRTGADQNGLQPDVRITFNPAYLRNELWFDPDPRLRQAPVPKGRTDAMSVMLHELGHALAYNGWSDGAGQPPAGFWSTFDRWILAGTPVLFDGPEVARVHGGRPDLTTDNVFHWANAGAPGTKATRHPPIAWLDGAPQSQPVCHGLPSLPAPSSIGRKGAAGGALSDQLMNGIAFYRGTRYDISALDRALLRDAGLPVDPAPVFFSGFE